MTDRAFDDDNDAPTIDGSAAPSRGGKKKLIILIAAPLLAIALIGGGLWASGLAGKLLGGGHAEEKKAEEKPVAKEAVFYDLPELLVNLNSSGRKTSFLKMSIALELASPTDVPHVQA